MGRTFGNEVGRKVSASKLPCVGLWLNASKPEFELEVVIYADPCWQMHTNRNKGSLRGSYLLSKSDIMLARSAKLNVFMLCGRAQADHNLIAWV